MLELRYRKIKILPSHAKRSRYQPLILTVLYAEERDAPNRKEAIRWKLVTDLPVRTHEDALEKLEWYALRWNIETFHKIMKSGCKAEDSKLRSAERLVNLMATFCIMSWRIFWMKMLNRSAHSMAERLVLTSLEVDLLDRLVTDEERGSKHKRLPEYLTKIARLGGYLARASDPPPGNTVMWRGLARLTDIAIGFSLATENCG